ncbi:Zn-ribbon domain-containing OB-fold protein [Pseudomonas sp. S2_C03]
MLDIRERAPYQCFVEGLERGVLTYQRCLGCNKAVFYLRTSCPGCGSAELELNDSQGIGTLYSSTVIFDKEQDYNVVLVDLDEGFRMMSTVIDCDSPSIGDRVQAKVQALESESPRVVFERVRGAHA